jgi:hypothetical protein
MNIPKCGFNTAIILVDIIGFSKLSNNRQYQAVQALQETTIKLLPDLGVNLSPQVRKAMIIGFIPTGDGFYLILHINLASYGILLGLALRNQLIAILKVAKVYHGVRVAVHFGVAIPFKDITGRLNFVGDGLNDAARLFEAKEGSKTLDIIKAFSKDDNYVLASRAAFKEFKEFFDKEEMSDSNPLRYVKYSTEFTIIAKHKKKHVAMAIETDRRIVMPVPPSLQISQKEIDQTDQILKKLVVS